MADAVAECADDPEFLAEVEKEASEMRATREMVRDAQRAAETRAWREGLQSGRLESQAEVVFGFAKDRCGTETAEKVWRLLPSITDSATMLRLLKAVAACTDRREFFAEVEKETDSLKALCESFSQAGRKFEAWASQEGRQRGRLEGKAQLIGHLAKGRFGTETAQRVSRLLAGVDDPERMERVAEAAAECADGREFLAEVRPVLESRRA